jgi:hypothetical protein
MKPTAITSQTEIVNVLGKSVWPGSDALLIHCAEKNSEMPICHSLMCQINTHTHTHTHNVVYDLTKQSISAPNSVSIEHY